MAVGTTSHSVWIVCNNTVWLTTRQRCVRLFELKPTTITPGERSRWVDALNWTALSQQWSTWLISYETTWSCGSTLERYEGGKFKRNLGPDRDGHVDWRWVGIESSWSQLSDRRRWLFWTTCTVNWFSLNSVETIEESSRSVCTTVSTNQWRN